MIVRFVNKFMNLIKFKSELFNQSKNKDGYMYWLIERLRLRLPRNNQFSESLIHYSDTWLIKTQFNRLTDRSGFRMIEIRLKRYKKDYDDSLYKKIKRLVGF